MLGLKLRDEFKGRRLKGTAIELSNDANTGATQVPARDFLEITYPTLDLLKGIEAVGPQQGRPVVVIGERGLGKSHLMAALYHTVSDPASTGDWLKSWSTTLSDPAIGQIPLRNGMLVIGESLHRQRYKFLWDILFERHPHGTYIKGKWEGMGASKTDIPSDQLILEMLRHSPTMLLLDEFQTWFDGLTKGKNKKVDLTLLVHPEWLAGRGSRPSAEIPARHIAAVSLPPSTNSWQTNTALQSKSGSSAPFSSETIDFGRVLWGEAWEYPQEIILAQGGKSVGLFHLRIT